MSIINSTVPAPSYFTAFAILTAMLNGARSDGEIDSYQLIIPGEEIVRKPVADRTAAEQATLANMVATRTFEVIISIVYGGSVHKLNVTLNFTGV